MADVDVETLLGVLQDDIRHVHVRITAAVGIALVVATQLPLARLRALSTLDRCLTLAGLALLLLSAASYFQYTQELNKLRLYIVAGLLPPQPGSPWIESWRRRFALRMDRRPEDWHDHTVYWYVGGQALLAAGTICVAYVFARLLLG